MKEDGILSNKYLGFITDIYSFLTKEYPNNTVYFSQYLNAPSCCIESKEWKYEWHIAENEMQNNEVWIFHNKDTLKHNDFRGMGYGEKLTNVIDQVKKFLNGEIKTPAKQMTICDYI